MVSGLTNVVTNLWNETVAKTPQLSNSDTTSDYLYWGLGAIAVGAIGIAVIKYLTSSKHYGRRYGGSNSDYSSSDSTSWFPIFFSGGDCSDSHGGHSDSGSGGCGGGCGGGGCGGGGCGGG